MQGKALASPSPTCALANRLRERFAEIEAAVATRVFAIAHPRETADPDYLHGLRASLPAALDFACAAIERGEEHAPDVPPTLLVQARMAARNRVGLDTVLRRYFTGYSLLTDFVIEEAERDELLGGAALQRLLREQAAVFDRLIEAVSEEYGREAAGRPSSGEQRRAERVGRLLAGEPIDATALGYELDAFHVGVIGAGSGAREAIKRLATRFDKSLLSVRGDEDKVLAWLGSRRRVEPADVTELIRSARASVSPDVVVAFGEPGAGAAGWRLTHRQAKAALPFAQRSPQRAARYSDIALMASVLGDDLLAISLRELYLTPLGADRDGGRTARETLGAYFASERNVSSAAASLGVKRHTVTNRLRAIEKTLGRPLNGCALEIEAALRIEGF